MFVQLTRQIVVVIIALCPDDQRQRRGKRDDGKGSRAEFRKHGKPIPQPTLQLAGTGDATPPHSPKQESIPGKG
jgi:hypothetical protein